MGKTPEQRLSDIYISNFDIIGEGFPAPLNSARRGFLEDFNLAGLPTTHDEKYRHTDLQKLFEPDYELYFTPPSEAVEITDRLPVSGYEVNVLNGFTERGTLLSIDASGIAFGSLKAAAVQMEDVVSKYYNTAADNSGEPLTALSSLFMQDGAFVYVPRGVKADRPFVLTFEYGSVEQAQMCFARALIIVEDGAEADVIISHHNAGSARFLVDYVRETIVGRGGVLNLSEVSRMTDDSALILGNYLRQEADSRVNQMNVWLRGGTTRVNAKTDLEGHGADSNLHGLWFGTGNERTDVTMRVNHLVPDCQSYEMVKGVVSQEAAGAFTGMVYVAKDAQRTLALQQSRNLLMSEAAKIYTEPQLEIYADDVKCSHGATVGQMDTEAIYYMRQRGISEEDARRLQMFGFVNDVISRCPHGETCNFMAALAEERIGEL